MKTLWHSLSFLRRELFQPEMRLVFLALVLTVAAMATVGLLTNRIAKTLVQQSNELLGADLVVVSSRAIPEAWRNKAIQFGLQTAEFQEFPSVLLAEEDSALAEIKAVTSGYPLSGELVLSRGQGSIVSQQIPESGDVWVENALLRKLELQIGDTVQLGKSQFVINAVIEQEPDRGGNLFSLAPRILMNQSDLAQTQLVGEGSRIKFRLLLAGDVSNIERYRSWLKSRLGQHYQLQSVRDSRPEVRASLDRAERFLALSLIVTIMLACLATWVAMQSWVQKRLINVAVLRTIGLTRVQILGLYLSQLILLSLLACVVALVIASGLQTFLVSLLQGYMSSVPPPADWQPALWACLLGVLLVLAFSIPAYWRLVSVSPMWVLRSMPDKLHQSRWSLSFGLLVLFSMLFALTRDIKLMVITLAALAGSLLLFVSLAMLIVMLLQRLRKYLPPSFKLGVQALTRHRHETLMSISVFGLSFVFVILLTLIRTDLIDQWRDRLPADTPNTFLINIQPAEVAGVEQWLSKRGMGNTSFSPMVRGRLVKINGRDVSGDDYQSDRAKRLMRREFNLSWSDELPPHNSLSQGEWWRANEEPLPQWSVESGIAATLGLKMGDTISFDVAGQMVTARISNLREVSWDSFKVNFFVIGTTPMLSTLSSRYISSFHLSASDRHLMNELVKQYPSVTVLDVDALMTRVRGIIDKVSYAAEAAFLFTLIAAILLVIAMVMSTRRLRQHENALLRTMGATRQILNRAQLIEFLLIGACAGVLAVVLANVAAWWISVELLDIGFGFNFPLAAAVVAAGMVLVMLTGWVMLKGQQYQTPLLLLRESE